MKKMNDDSRDTDKMLVVTNDVDNPDIIESLKLEYKNAMRNIDKESPYREWVYANLRITLLEKVFFILYARFNNKTRTKMLRTYIRACMRRNPKMVEEAKKLIDEEVYDEMDEWR